MHHNMITYFNTTGLVSCRNSLESHIFKLLMVTEEIFMKGWNPLSKGTQLFTHNFINVSDSNYNVESLIFKNSQFLPSLDECWEYNIGEFLVLTFSGHANRKTFL